MRTFMPAVMSAAVLLLRMALPAGAQVAPADVSAEHLRTSLEAVLGVDPADISWAAIPLRAEDKKAVRPQLKNTRQLPDTLHVGRVATDAGPRLILLDRAPSRSEQFSLALYLDRRGEVLDVDILTYRENYGYEIDYPIFRRQFHGTRKPQALVFRRSIQNISGATISARSLTYAVRDLLVLTRHLGMPALLR